MQLDGSGDGVTSRREVERLASLLEGPSLTRSEARLLVAVVRLGSATHNQLTDLTGISRSNLYPALEALRAKRLVERRPGYAAVWESSGVDRVMARVRELELERLASDQDNTNSRLDQATDFLADLLAEADTGGPALAVTSYATAGPIYEETLPSTRDEILVFNRGPYPADLAVHEGIIDALARGVKARAVWQKSELAGRAAAVREIADAYDAAGVEQRVIDELPISLAILDQTLALMALPGEEGGDIAYPTAAVCRHPGLAQVLAAGFQQYWDKATPYRSGQADRGRATTQLTQAIPHANAE